MITRSEDERLSILPESGTGIERERDLDDPRPATFDGPLIQRATAASGSPAGSRLSAGDVRILQRMVGNRAVRSLMEGDGQDPETSRHVATRGLEGGGTSLPWLDRLQSSFGQHDLSGVRAFTDDSAKAASRAIGAEAYAAGERVAFSSSSPSLRTVAHEAAHVVQQRSGVEIPGGVGREGDPYERQADAIADKVVHGQPVGHLLPASSPGGSAGSSTSSQSPVQMLRAEDIARLYAGAELELPAFTALIERLAKATGGKAIYRKGVKDMRRAIDKASEKVEKEGAPETRAVTELTDILGGTIVYDDLRSFLAGYTALGRRLEEHGARIVRLKNRITDQLNRDFLINIRMASGHVIELQLHLKPTLDTKQKLQQRASADPLHEGGRRLYSGHDAYDYVRILDPLFNSLGRINFRSVLTLEQRHQHVRQRSYAARFLSPQEVARIDRQLKKERTQENYRDYLKRLLRLYADVQKELMRKAWDQVMTPTHAGAAFRAIKAIPNYQANDYRQNFDLVRTYYQQGTTADQARLNQKFRKHRAVAERLLAAPAEQQDTASTLATLRTYHAMLQHKHEEKRRKQKIEGTTAYGLIDSFLGVMERAIATLEEEARDEERERRRLLNLARQQVGQAARVNVNVPIAPVFLQGVAFQGLAPQIQQGLAPQVQQGLAPQVQQGLAPQVQQGPQPPNLAPQVQQNLAPQVAPNLAPQQQDDDVEDNGQAPPLLPMGTVVEHDEEDDDQ